MPTLSSIDQKARGQNQPGQGTRHPLRPTCAILELASPENAVADVASPPDWTTTNCELNTLTLSSSVFMHDDNPQEPTLISVSSGVLSLGLGVWLVKFAPMVSGANTSTFHFAIANGDASTVYEQTSEAIANGQTIFGSPSLTALIDISEPTGVNSQVTFRIISASGNVPAIEDGPVAYIERIGSTSAGQ